LVPNPRITGWLTVAGLYIIEVFLCPW